MTYRALVVDDDPEILEVVGDVLDSLGHEFDTATCQDEARRLLAEYQYSYHLLDLEIPVRPNRGFPRIQNGENLLREIAACRNGRPEPILVMTGHGTDSPKLAVQMMKLGAADYITKPFATVGRTLDRAILEALEAARRSSPQGGIRLEGGEQENVTAGPFAGGDLTFHPNHVELLGVKIISDRGTGQCLAVLNQLRRKDSRGRFIRMSGEELALAIGAVGGLTTVTACIQTLRRNIVARLRKAGIAVDRTDVINHDEQGYYLQDCISVRDAGDDPAHVPAVVPALQPDVPAHGVDRRVPRVLNERQQWVLRELQHGTKVRRAMLEQEFDVADKTAKRDLAGLSSRGAVEFVRVGRDGYYRLARATQG